MCSKGVGEKAVNLCITPNIKYVGGCVMAWGGGQLQRREFAPDEG